MKRLRTCTAALVLADSVAAAVSVTTVLKQTLFYLVVSVDLLLVNRNLPALLSRRR